MHNVEPRGGRFDKHCKNHGLHFMKNIRGFLLVKARIKPLNGWGCSSLGRASDRHATDAGSIPRCGKGFFSQSQLSVQTLTCVRVPPCAIACIYISAHVKDLVVHVRVRWIMETLKHPACTVGWVARLCRSWLSPGKAPQISHGRNPIGTIRL